MAPYKIGAFGQQIRVLESAPLSPFQSIEYTHMQKCMAAAAASDFQSRACGTDLPDGAADVAYIFAICDAMNCGFAALEYLAQ